MEFKKAVTGNTFVRRLKPSLRDCVTNIKMIITVDLKHIVCRANPACRCERSEASSRVSSLAVLLRNSRFLSLMTRVTHGSHARDDILT